MRIKEVTYNINTSKHLNNINIIHLSDIHFCDNYETKRLAKILKIITERKPNYVCITGDLMDTYDAGTIRRNSDIFLKWLEDMGKLSKVIIIIGNHDIKSKEKEWRELDSIFIMGLKRIENVHFLVNDLYYDNGICFMGYNPPIAYYISHEADSKLLYNDFKKCFPSISRHFYNILLIHTPIGLVESNILNYLKNVDVVLAGHTHGGLLPLWVPGNWGIISPFKKLFPKYVRGIIIRKNTSIIISSGIIKLSDTSGPFFRRFNDFYAMHIVKIKITKKKNAL